MAGEEKDYENEKESIPTDDNKKGAGFTRARESSKRNVLRSDRRAGWKDGAFGHAEDAVADNHGAADVGAVLLAFGVE